MERFLKGYAKSHKMHDIAIIMTDRKIKLKPKKVALAKLEHIYNVPNGKVLIEKRKRIKNLKRIP